MKVGFEQRSCLKKRNSRCAEHVVPLATKTASHGYYLFSVYIYFTPGRGLQVGSITETAMEKVPLDSWSRKAVVRISLWVYYLRKASRRGDFTNVNFITKITFLENKYSALCSGTICFFFFFFPLILKRVKVLP